MELTNGKIMDYLSAPNALPTIIRQVWIDAHLHAAKIAEDEQVDADATQDPTDFSYNRACQDVANAIREAANG